MQFEHIGEWESASPEAIASHQMRTLKTVLLKAARNPFYKARWPNLTSSLETLRSMEEFRAIVPTIGKADFLADQTEFPPYGSCLGRHEIDGTTQLFFYTTSGTSGQGQELHAETAEELQASAEVYAFMFKWAGLGPGDLVFLTLPLSMLGGGRLEYHAALACGLQIMPIGSYDAGRKVELLNRFKPKAIIGTTSYFGHLAAVSGETKPGYGAVSVLFCGGEGVSTEYYQRLEKEWGAACFDRYGSTQSRNDHMFTCGSAAHRSDGVSVLHNIDPYMLLEVVNPETGEHVGPWERGEVVITSLYHKAAPLIRYKMNDSAVYVPPGACRCGRPFGGVEASSIVRTDNMIRIKGINVWPQAVESVLLEDAAVDEYAISVDTDETGSDRISVQVMPNKEMSAIEKRVASEQIAIALYRKIGIHFNCEILEPGSFARSEYKAKNWIDRRTYKSVARSH